MLPVTKFKKPLLLCTSILAMELAVAVAYAQTPTGEMEEIVVSARRREESLLEVPVAVSAIPAAELERRNIETIAQVGQSIPNMTFQTGAPTGTGASTPSIFIRGIGSSETSLGTEPGVGLYVDDVYIARSVGSVLDLVDAESVEVLRGPQGTLFGRNSIGGAILIRSKRPGDEFGGFVELSTGRFNRTDAKFSMDLPLADTLRVNLSGMRAERDGYVKSADSKAMGDIDRAAGRIAIEFQPTEDLRMTLTGDITHADETAMPAVLLGLVDFIPGTQFAPGGPFPSSIFAISNNAARCGGASTTRNSGRAGCIDQQYILGPFQTAGGYRSETPIFDSQGSRPYGNRALTDVRGASYRAEWNATDTVTFKSISAYRELEAYWASNSDHTANPGIETKNDQEQQQFTQELQVLVDYESFNWVAGGFYMHEKGDALNVVAFPEVIFRSGGGFSTKSGALFAQGTYEIVPDLKLTAGLRYTDETKTYGTLNNQQVIGVLVDTRNRVWLDLRATPVPFITGATPDLKTDEFTPHVNLSYQWTPDAMTYASYSRGYKSGGYEQRLAPGTPAVPRFEPEVVDTYEVGAKAAFAGRRFTLSAAAFQSNYDDMQISVVDGVAPTITNAGDATLKGFELEAGWHPVEGANLSAFLGYLDSEYDTLSPRALFSGITLNSRLPNTSKWQYGLAASYDIALSSDFFVRPQAEWSYRSSLELDSANERLLHQDGYSLINASLTLGTSDEQWALTLSGRNLTNEKYLVAGIAQYNIGEIEGQYARPREWGLALKYRW